MIFVVMIMLTFLSGVKSMNFFQIPVNHDQEVLIEKLFSVMGKPYSICFWDDKKSNDLLDFIFNQCFEKDIAVTIEMNSIHFIQSCDVFVFLNVLSSNICSLFFKNKDVYLTFDYKIILVTNLRLSDDFVQMEHCASSFDSASVTLIALQAEILVLDSPFISPRRFRPISSNNPTGSGSSLYKLHGRIINVATFQFPPFIEIIMRNGSLGDV